MAAGKGRKLVIVESPAKAKTIAGYLGGDFDVEASVGHIRDLPNPSELPVDMKKGPFGKFAIDVDNGFEAYYVVDTDKKKKVAELKRLLKDADELYLATDEDREGEAIAWHLLETLQPQVPVKRMVFHEITREAIQRAVNDTRELDTALVDAQETRRILDRLYGYEVSPGALAQGPPGPVRRPRAVRRHPHGRRARARADGVPGRVLLGRRGRVHDAEQLRRPVESDAFTARLSAVDGDRVATGRDFADTGELKHKSVVHLDEAMARAIATAVQEAPVVVTERPGEALHASSGRAVHDLDAPAGGVAQAAAVLEERHARRAAALRERLHHLHAHRLDHVVGERDHRRTEPGARPLRRRLRARRATPV